MTKIKRMVFIKIHLYLSGVIIVLLSLFSLSGSLHLLSDWENETKKVVFTSKDTHLSSKMDLQNFFTANLKQIVPDYKFDYIKGSPDRLMTRPTSRTFYTIKYNKGEGSVSISEVSPNLIKSLMEFHKGHGPKVSRTFLGISGFIIFLSALSGLWLGISIKVYRNITLATLATGLMIFVILFFA